MYKPTEYLKQIFEILEKEGFKYKFISEDYNPTSFVNIIQFIKK